MATPVICPCPPAEHICCMHLRQCTLQHLCTRKTYCKGVHGLSGYVPPSEACKSDLACSASFEEDLFLRMSNMEYPMSVYTTPNFPERPQLTLP